MTRRHLTLAMAALLAACSSSTEPGVNPDLVTVQIGPAGGIFTSKDNTVTVVVPAGALATTTTLSLVPLDPDDLGAEFDGLDIAAAFELGPDGSTFGQPLTVSFYVGSPAASNDSVIEFDAQTLLTAGAVSLDSVRMVLSGDSLFLVAELDHFSPVVKERLGGAVRISLNGVPDAIPRNQNFDVTVTVGGSAVAGLGASGRFNDATASLPDNVVERRFGPAEGELTVQGVLLESPTIAFGCKANGEGRVSFGVSVQLTPASGQDQRHLWTRIGKDTQCVEPPPATITVEKTGSGSGTVSSIPAGISCGADCSQTWVYATGFLLTAVPDAASVFRHYEYELSPGVTVQHPGPILDWAAWNDLTIGAVFEAKPTIASIDPSTATAGGPEFVVTVVGTGYVAGRSVVYMGNTPLVTTFVSGTTVTAVVPSSEITAPGPRDITVRNTDGGTSGAATLTVEEAAGACDEVSLLEPGTPANGAWGPGDCEEGAFYVDSYGLPVATDGPVSIDVTSASIHYLSLFNEDDEEIDFGYPSNFDGPVTMFLTAGNYTIKVKRHSASIGTYILAAALLTAMMENCKSMLSFIGIDFASSLSNTDCAANSFFGAGDGQMFYKFSFVYGAPGENVTVSMSSGAFTPALIVFFFDENGNQTVVANSNAGNAGTLIMNFVMPAGGRVCIAWTSTGINRGTIVGAFTGSVARPPE